MGDDFAHEGTYSQKLRMPAPISQKPYRRVGVYQRVEVVPGANYTAAMYARMTLGGEPSVGEDMAVMVGIDPYGDTDIKSGGIVWSHEVGNKDTWVPVEVSAQSEGAYITVYFVCVRKWPRFDAGFAWLDTTSLTGPAVPTPTPTPTGTLPTSTPTVTPTPTPPNVVGPELVFNGGFEGEYVGGVADGWLQWQTAGATGFWRRSTLAGTIGTGNYFVQTGWYEETRDMRPKTVLLGDGYGAAADFAHEPEMRDSIMIGRPFIDHFVGEWILDPDLSDEDIINNARDKYVDGIGTGGYLGIRQEAIYHPRVDVWTGINEPDWNNREQWRRVQLFEKAATEYLHSIGIKTLVLNLAVGNPGNIHRMADPEVRELFEIADYVGYHPYGGPVDQLMITPYLEGTNYDDPYEFSLRWRVYADMYSQQGWRMPPVIYTEGTTYAGWVGVFPPEAIQEDLIAFIDFIKEDPWAIGLCLFCAGGSGIWRQWDVSGTGIGVGVSAANQAQPVDSVEGLRSQQFGQGEVHPTTHFVHTGLFDGGIVQLLSGLQVGAYYRLSYWTKYAFRGMQPQIQLYDGLDFTGQTLHGDAATIQWSHDYVAAGKPTQTHEVFYQRERYFQATAEQVSVWLRAVHPEAQTSFMVMVDDVSVRLVDPGWIPPGTPSPSTPTPVVDTPTPAATNTPVPPTPGQTVSPTATPTAAVVCCIGDANKDGSINQHDYRATRDNFGATYPDTGIGDANCDGAVNQHDYRATRDHFGYSCD